MEQRAYRGLLEECVGYTPALLVSAEQVEAYNPALVQNPDRVHVIPFAGLILHFHEAIFSTPEGVHEFLRTHFTRELRALTFKMPLNVRAHPIAGADVLRQLSKKGLIVDLPVLTRVQRLVSHFPLPLKDSTKPHILHRFWHFYTLTPQDRRFLAQKLGQGLDAPMVATTAV